jgi:hypothetical protein
MAKKFDHDVLLRWRSQLTDHEVDVLIPAFEPRLEGMKDIFEKLIETLNTVEKDPLIIASIDKILNPHKFPTDPNLEHASASYCKEIRAQIKDQFISKIDSLRKNLKTVDNYRSFSKLMNEITQFSGSITQNKTTLFLFSLKPFVHMTNTQTKEILTTAPIEYAMILRPFDLWLDNLDQIAMSCFSIVDDWFKTQHKWKAEYLSFRANESMANNNKTVLYVNIFTVILAFAISCIFLFVPDILNLKRENIELKGQRAELQATLDKSLIEISELKMNSKSPKSLKR